MDVDCANVLQQMGHFRNKPFPGIMTQSGKTKKIIKYWRCFPGNKSYNKKGGGILCKFAE